MNPQLDICLLGPPSIRRNGERIAGFVSRSAQALFYFLAMSGQRHDRSWLASLLWPETAETVARKNLRDILSNLRKLFERELHITPDSVGFAEDCPYILDVRTFESLARQWEKETDPQALQQMTTLYRGDFLEGFHLPGPAEFESWLLYERERLRDQAIWAMDILIGLALEQKEYATGLTLSRRLLNMEPWREKTHRQRMLLLAASGQRHAAIAQYEQCKAYLQSEFGVEPMAETTHVYHQVRASQLEDMTEFPLAGAPNIGAHPSAPVRHNLPRLYTPLFGRECEIAELVEKLGQPTYPLVTLTGEGGVGKTRLALAVAQRLTTAYPDGVWFAPLATLDVEKESGGGADGESFMDAFGAMLAHAMQLPFLERNSVLDRVIDALRTRKVLLVLDNFEHLTRHATVVLRILDASPRSSILVTSRHRLNLQAEWVFTLSGLPVPHQTIPTASADVTRLAQQFSSLQLFSERASRSGTAFSLGTDNLAAVLTICRLLDGLPLGIELAAGLAPALSPAQIAATLEQSHHILATEWADIPARHRSLQAVLDYSWRLLSDTEAQTLTRCALFNDRFNVAAAEAITGFSSQQLQMLCHKSLLRQLENAHFVMQPVVRRWAYEKLAQNARRLEEAKIVFQNYFIGLISDCAAQVGNDAGGAHPAHAQFTHILTAWRFAIEQKNIEMFGRGAQGLSQLFRFHGTYQEGAQHFTRAAECVRAMRAQADAPGNALTIHGRLLVEAGYFHSRIGQLDLTRSEAHEALVIAQQTGDRALEIDSLKNLAYAAWFSGDLEAGEAYIEEELRLARLAGDPEAESYGLGGVAIILQHKGLIDQAIEKYECAIELAQIAGEIQMAMLQANLLGTAYLAKGNLWLANIHFRSLLSLRRRVGDTFNEGVALLSLAQTTLALGDLTEAVQHGQAALSIFRRQVTYRHESRTLSQLAHTFHQMGDQETAHAYAQQALQVADDHHIAPARAHALLTLGTILIAQGQLHDAQATFTEALQMAEQIKETNIVTCAQVRCARVLLALRQNHAAHELVERALPQLPQLENDWSFDPVGIYVQSYAVLKAHGDPTAQMLLEAGHRLLCRVAEQIGDDGLKKRFLHNVPSHRELLHLWEKQAGVCKASAAEKPSPAANVYNFRPTVT